MSPHDTPTEPKIQLRNVETIVFIENLWERLLSDIDKVYALEDRTENVSLLVALSQVQRALYETCQTLNRASAIARRDGK